MKKKTQRKKQFTLMLVLFMLVESLLSTSLVYDVQALPQNDEVTEQTVTKTQENPAGEQIDTGAAGTEENGQATDSSDTQQSQVSDGAQNTSDLPEEETDENGGISAPTDESQQTTPSNEDEQPADQQQTTEDEDEASSDDAAGEEQSQEQTDENDSELTPEQKAEETEEDETKIGDLLAEDPSFVITENNLTLQIGDEKQLYAKENGQNVTPQWESSNSQVATVSATGVVTAVAKGSAVISAAINGKKAECLVTVIEKTTSNTVRYSVLILDATHSMKGTALTREKQAAQKFCKTILAADGKNYIAVVVMQGKKTRVVCNMTSSYKELEKIIKKVKAKGGTNIETAFQKADKLLDKVESGKDVVKNIVLCSDGLPQSGKKLSSGKYTKKDHSSYYKYANAVYKKAKEVKKKGIYIYALGFFHNSKDKDLKFGKKFMEDIASADKYYSIKNTKDIEQAMKKIAKKITSVSINKKKATMRVKDTLHLYVTINGVPASAVWTSSDPSVAAVNTDGTVTAFKKGNVIITATVDGKQKLTCAIKVKPAPTIKIRSSISLYKGCKKKLKVKVTGKSKKVKWKSSNKKVVRVTKKGTLIAVKPGRAVITVKANGVKATCNVTVLKPTISIAVNKYLNKVVLFKKESQKLKVTVHGKSKKVKWKSTNPKVAGVTKKGTVKARKTGVCYIIATANGVSAKVKVKVEQRHPVRSFYRKVKTSITPKGSKKINEEGAQLITENKKEKIQKAAVCIYKQNGNYYFVAACTGKNLTSLICNCYLGYNGKKVYDAYNTAGHYSYMNKYYFQKDSYGVWSLYGTYAPIRFNVTDQYGRYLTPKGTGVNGKYFRSFKDLNKMKKWLQK